MTRPDLTLVREYEAALAWWQAAGVTHDFVDDATVWLAPELQVAAPGAPSGNGKPTGPTAGTSAAANDTAHALRTAERPKPVAERRNWWGDSPPADLAAFGEWWMTAPGLDTARAFPRIAPRGQAGAALMVLVPQPEEADRDRLLSGPQGQLLANIIAALGLDDDAVYIAAALPCHTPMADLAGLAAQGFDTVTAHHIGLVKPARLLAFGTGLAPLLGADPAHGLREINYIGGKTPVLASEALDALMEMPRLKARFWRRWMEWSATL